MVKLKNSFLNLPDQAWLLVSLGFSFFCVCLGISSIFSTDTKIETLHSKLQISNNRLKLAETASKVHNLSQDTELVLLQLKEANNAHAKTIEVLNNCQGELSNFLPALQDHPLDLPSAPAPISDKKLDRLNQELKQTQSEIKQDLDAIYQ